MHTRSRLAPALLLGGWFCLFLPGSARAQPVPPSPVDSRISQVTVYPGSATVERTARVAAGSSSVAFACLPASLDVQSVQVSGDASLRVGEVSVSRRPRALPGRCADQALDDRIRVLEERKEALAAEGQALGLVTGYLKSLSGTGDDAAAKRPAIDAKNLVNVADALRRTAQDALARQQRIARQQGDIDLQLKPLLAERTRQHGAADDVIDVTVRLTAVSDAQLRLSYQVNGPGWTPTYRASLDTTTRRIRIERQAQLAQSTGEDWRGAKLVLSTGQPRRDTSGRLPMPWRIGIAPPAQAHEAALRQRFAPAAAAAPAPMLAKQEPAFDVAVFDNAFATEFRVAREVDVPTGGQQVTVALGDHDDAVKLAVRTSPHVDASAFLVADMAVPGGVWPAGPMQLYRDGAFVGQGHLNVLSGDRLTLSFGRDELVRVEARPEHDSQGTSGFVGSRAQRSVQRAYAVENRHRAPITVQLVEAAPVSVDEQVRVETRFAPQPTDTAWKGQPGVTLWTMEVGAGQTARVSADYLVSYPKEARLQEP